MQRIIRKVKSIQKKLEFAKYCYSYGDDQRFVQDVKAIGKLPEAVFLL